MLQLLSLLILTTPVLGSWRLWVSASAVPNPGTFAFGQSSCLSYHFAGERSCRCCEDTVLRTTAKNVCRNESESLGLWYLGKSSRSDWPSWSQGSRARGTIRRESPNAFDKPVDHHMTWKSTRLASITPTWLCRLCSWSYCTIEVPWSFIITLENLAISYIDLLLLICG